MRNKRLAGLCTISSLGCGAEPEASWSARLTGQMPPAMHQRHLTPQREAAGPLIMNFIGQWTDKTLDHPCPKDIGRSIKGRAYLARAPRPLMKSRMRLLMMLLSLYYLGVQCRDSAETAITRDEAVRMIRNLEKLKSKHGPGIEHQKLKADCESVIEDLRRMAEEASEAASGKAAVPGRRAVPGEHEELEPTFVERRPEAESFASVEEERRSEWAGPWGHGKEKEISSEQHALKEPEVASKAEAAAKQMEEAETAERQREEAETAGQEDRDR